MTLLTNSAPRRLPVRVVASPLTDLIVAMWSVIAEQTDLESFEQHDQVIAVETAANLSQEDRDWMAEAFGHRWTFMIELIANEDLQTIDELVAAIDRTDPTELFANIDHDTEECDTDECATHLAITDPTGDKQRLIEVLKSISSEAEVIVKEGAAALGHDRMLTEFLARRLDPEQVIETVTNGIAYRLDRDVDDVVLIPSLMVRPYNLLFAFGSGRYFVYSVSDEATQADADSPPTWMVDMFKALGDERRLRLLRRLAEGPAGLIELTELIDVAKSTAHHHLRLLRAAGLVRAVISGPGKDGTHYELRPNTLNDAAHFVSEYLRTEPIGGA